MKHLRYGLAALFLSVSVIGMAAPKKPATKSAKKPAVQVVYKAQCGMSYTATQAKKHRYICPMDKKPLKKIISKTKKQAP